MDDPFELIERPQWSGALVADLEHLTMQLSSRFTHKTPRFEAALHAILQAPGAHLVVARHVENGHVMGCALLSEVVTPLGAYGVIDHVVVDEAARGYGLGKRLMQTLEDIAQRQSLSELHLTSNPSRTAARKLYAKLGFEAKETTFFVKQLA